MCASRERDAGGRRGRGLGRGRARAGAALTSAVRGERCAADSGSTRTMTGAARAGRAAWSCVAGAGERGGAGDEHCHANTCCSGGPLLGGRGCRRNTGCARPSAERGKPCGGAGAAHDRTAHGQRMAELRTVQLHTLNSCSRITLGATNLDRLSCLLHGAAAGKRAARGRVLRSGQCSPYRGCRAM